MAASFFKIFPSEYNNHTFTHQLSAEETGVFFRVVLINAWNNEGIVIGDDSYNAMAANVPLKLWLTCKEKFIQMKILAPDGKGNFTHGQQVSKYITAANYSKTQSQNSKAKQLKFEKKVREELAVLTAKPQPIY